MGTARETVPCTRRTREDPGPGLACRLHFDQLAQEGVGASSRKSFVDKSDPFSARCQNREEHSPLAINTAEFVHALVLLAAGLALCYGESIN
jgi:hypothetical protein